MTAGRRIFQNIRALAAAKAATMASGLVTAAWTARVLGPDSFGVLGFGTSLMAYAALFVNLGLSTYAVREIARDRDEAGPLSEHVLTLRTVLALVVGALYAAFVLSLDKPMAVKAVLLVQAVQLLGNALVLDFVYQATERMGVIATREIGTSIGSMLLVFLLVRGPDDAIVAAAITGGAITVNALIMIGRFRRDFGRLRPRIDLRVWREILTAATPMAVGVFAWAIFTHLDVVMLGFMAPHAEVGWYSAAVKVQTLANLAGNIVMNAFLPQLAASHGDLDHMRERMRAYATVMLTVGALVVAGGLALAPSILATLFGGAYDPAALPLRILMVASAVVYANMILGNPLLVWHRQTGYMIAMLAGGALNAVLNVWWIPRYGIQGAAMATLTAELAATVAIAWLHRKVVGELYGRLAARAALCGGLAIAAALALQRFASPLLEKAPAIVDFLAGGAVVVGVFTAATLLTGLVQPTRLRRLTGVVA
ncbi:O-antigen/teichoic acid export membrane protein [Azospirillum agricola]|uniref:flippase n=1 Tax=Azospirillum agricola TaxID=1720247 RepID=UPI001AEA37C7|nr:flippase [Azospirillum agricola]MBP2230268.1 O-antigen/teichoic acid export membrane protein [Azospirillum agricola]